MPKVTPAVTITALDTVLDTALINAESGDICHDQALDHRNCSNPKLLEQTSFCFYEFCDIFLPAVCNSIILIHEKRFIEWQNSGFKKLVKSLHYKNTSKGMGGLYAWSTICLLAGA